MILDGKSVLVTGGTGSLGRALVLRLLRGELGTPARVTVFSRDEAKQHDMRVSYLHRQHATDDVIYLNSGHALRFHIGDVRDYDALRRVVRDHQIVVHAAALKQVPTCEYVPFEAVQTNVIGANNLVRAVTDDRSAVETVVGLSTDKACNPFNVMGMTKALMERILTEANLRSETRFICVRYGNVLGTRGSVVPLFVEQIANGGPVTITLPEMTRFLLTLDDAIDTILTALRHALPGEVCVAKAPAARMVDVVAVLIGDRQIPIRFTGLRPGEKIHEVLVAREECYRTVERAGHFMIGPMLPELAVVTDDPVTLLSEYSSEQAGLDRAALHSLLTPYMHAAAVEEKALA